MFNEISKAMKDRMALLEKIDLEDRSDGTERMKRLRQIPPDTGKFISMIAANCPDGEYVEIGTSAGYSAMWLSLAMKIKKTRLKTHELLPEKIKLAKETFGLCGISDAVVLIEGDALKNLLNIENIAFCFIDCEKELYAKCWDIVSEKMVKGGMIIADNSISHKDAMQPMLKKAFSDSRYDSLIVPIGTGELVARKI
jgi:caffeoyl-CoA O-methyltransferase